MIKRFLSLYHGIHRKTEIVHRKSIKNINYRLADFADMNAVYAEPYPARSAVAVKTLPKGALVEIEVVAS